MISFIMPMNVYPVSFFHMSHSKRTFSLQIELAMVALTLKTTSHTLKEESGLMLMYSFMLCILGAQQAFLLCLDRVIKFLFYFGLNHKH